MIGEIGAFDIVMASRSITHMDPLPHTDLLDTLSETKYEYYVEAKIGQNASRPAIGVRVFALGRTQNMLNYYSW